MGSTKAAAPKVESQTDILHEASRRFGVAKRAIEEFNDKARELLGEKGQYNSTKVRSVNIALIGDVKSGKSSSGNVLLDQTIFPQSFWTMHITANYCHWIKRWKTFLCFIPRRQAPRTS